MDDLDKLLKDMDVYILTAKRKADKLLRFNLLVGSVWAILACVNIISGQIYLALTYMLLLTVYGWVSHQQFKHPKYWWRAFRPAYVSIDGQVAKENEHQIALWVKNKFNYNCYYHGNGVFAFRKNKQAMAFKLRWGGV